MARSARLRRDTVYAPRVVLLPRQTMSREDSLLTDDKKCRHIRHATRRQRTIRWDIAEGDIAMPHNTAAASFRETLAEARYARRVGQRP